MMSIVKAGSIKLRRAYDPAERTDGVRILVDRLWPRGLSRDDACIDQWVKDLAPSNELRKWFGHDPARWDEFRDRYAVELNRHSDQMKELRELARKGPITLVYSAHDEVHNNAVVLRDFILGKINLVE
jgi:uncharacterized protein YeaO (DUF488 family)